MKKGLFILCLLLALCVAAVPVQAAEAVHSGTCGENLTWTLDDAGTLTISGNGLMEDYSWGMPPWFDYAEEIVSVVVEPGVTGIGSYAFADLPNMTSISLPDGLINIGECAMSSCYKLTTVVIPDGVTLLDYSAFEYCGHLTNIVLPDSITEIHAWAFAECFSLVNIYFKGTAEQKEQLLYSENELELECIREATWHCNVEWREQDGQMMIYCLVCDGYHDPYETYFTDGLTWSLEEGVLTISGEGPMCNYHNYHLPQWWESRQDITKVVIEPGVTSIGDSAFNFCEYLESITIPDTVTSIGELAFYECDSLVDIVLPDGITSIGDSAFDFCQDLPAINLPDALETIGEYAFKYCSSLQELTIPDGVTSIGTGAFSCCSNLQSIVIPESVTAIAEYTFEWCCGLQSITLHDGITSIGYSAFDCCESLQSITIPDGVTEIANNTFFGCSGLQSVTVPESVTAIGSNAFCGCYGLTQVILPQGISEIQYGTFSGCSALACIIVPEGVTTIGEHAFEDCDALSTIFLPKSITSIEEYAFYNDSELRKIHYFGTEEQRADITVAGYNASIGNQTWHYAPVEVTLDGQQVYHCSQCGRYYDHGGRIPYIGSCGANAFWVVHGDTLVISGTGSIDQYDWTDGWGEYTEYITSAIIEPGISSIAPWALDELYVLQNITIPDTLTEVGETGLRNFSSSGIVHYMGTQAQRDEMVIGEDNDNFINATWHYETAKKEVDGQLCYDCVDCGPYYYPVVDETPVICPTLTGKSFSLSFEDEILVNFYYTAEKTDNVAEQGMLVFYSDPGAAEISKADDVYAGSATDGSVFVNTTHGIAAKYMGDSRYYCAYAKLTDGSYVYSPLYQYSPKKYAMNMLGKTSTSEKQKALCVAMLNYGAAAQNFFGYRTDDLMNASLTDEQKALAAAYDESLFTGAVPADSSKIANFAKTATGFSKRNASLSFEGAFSINYYFTPDVEVDGELTLYYWTPEDYAAATTLTVDNASGSSSMVAADGNYWGQVSGIAAKKLDDTYYVAGVYSDAEGNVYCTGVIAYSLSKYCMNNAKEGKTMQELAAATAMYGYYAKAYFG